MEQTIFPLHRTFSPISVMSPDGSTWKSGASEQASTTVIYELRLKGFPNKILSFNVAFCIHGCWGTYPTLPCEQDMDKRYRHSFEIVVLRINVP